VNECVPAVPKFTVETVVNELVQLISMIWLLSAWRLIFQANWLVSGAHTAVRLGENHALAVPPNRTRDTKSIAIAAVTARDSVPTAGALRGTVGGRRKVAMTACTALPTFGTGSFSHYGCIYPGAGARGPPRLSSFVTPGSRRPSRIGNGTRTTW
jgi:hypothetical protein